MASAVLAAGLAVDLVAEAAVVEDVAAEDRFDEDRFDEDLEAEALVVDVVVEPLRRWPDPLRPRCALPELVVGMAMASSAA
ncbi:hypothetical protein [Saccharopolyspora dendranthemae]|uniref:hypothetical protein n=1 Tax=Saccharopolyspora dendranthemae TaxID=1181886 RepID=UPI0011A675DE|nr:hypothetical protein [Saccharopolyspora dendranthemae]